MASNLRRRCRLFALTAAAALLLASGSWLRGQGCSQCRDNVAQTNPAVQASYRSAILTMLAAVAVLSTTALIVIRKQK